MESLSVFVFGFVYACVRVCVYAWTCLTTVAQPSPHQDSLTAVSSLSDSSTDCIWAKILIPRRAHALLSHSSPACRHAYADTLAHVYTSTHTHGTVCFVKLVVFNRRHWRVCETESGSASRLCNSLQAALAALMTPVSPNNSNHRLLLKVSLTPFC